MLLLTGATVIDGTGQEPTENAAVLIEDQRIVAVGPEASLEAPAETVQRYDLRGKTLLPGLIDCHVHILHNPDPRAQPYSSIGYLVVPTSRSRALLPPTCRAARSSDPQA